MTETTTLHDCPMCDTFPFADPMDLLDHIKSAHAAGMALAEPTRPTPEQVLAKAFPGATEVKNARFERTTTPWGTTTARKVTNNARPASGHKIRCGSCKATHASVAEVRTCAGVSATAAPTTRNTNDLDADTYKGPNPYATEDGRTCEKCQGSGVYGWGASVNGRMSRSGPCFACGGKGKQTDCGEDTHATRLTEINAGRRTKEACCDRVRNDLYWRFGVRIYL